MRKKKILPFATTWMALEDIMLNEISQKKKDKYYMVSLHVKSKKKKKKKKVVKAENKLVVTSGWEVWEWERCCLRDHT